MYMALHLNTVGTTCCVQSGLTLKQGDVNEATVVRLQHALQGIGIQLQCLCTNRAFRHIVQLISWHPILISSSMASIQSCRGDRPLNP